MFRIFSNIFIVVFFIFQSCSVQPVIKDGKTAFNRKQYKIASELLEKEFSKTDSRVQKGKIAWLIGQSYKSNGEAAKSTRWFKIAYDNQYGVEALREYAFSLKQTENYSEAESAFKNLGQELGSPFEYRKEITACQSAQKWLKLKSDNPYKVYPAAFNTSDNEYAPLLSTNGDLYFSADSKTPNKKEKYLWTGRSYSDLYMIKAGQNNKEKLSDIFNTSFNEGTMTMNAARDEIVFTRCFSSDKTDQYCKLMSTVLKDGEWSTPHPIEFQQERINYMHPAFSANASMLFFSSNDPNGIGGYDLYFSKRIKSGWQDPVLLPRNINTTGNEKFPFIDKDTLYFASDGLAGMGGLDIYKVSRTGENSWNPPVNLQAPMNSGSDDFGLTIDPDFKPDSKVFQRGYFTSNRPDGSGNDDIYEYKLVKAEPKPVQAPPGDIYLDVYVLEKIRKDPADPNSTVLARKPIEKASLSMITKDEKQIFEIKNGEKISIKLKQGVNYKFNGSSSGFLTNSASFSTAGINPLPGEDIRFDLEIVLDKVFKNKEINLENIYYDFDKWDIRADAIPTLNKLAELLISNPEIKIQLASHTDCRGTTGYNQTLSQKRAQSVVDYLITQKIAPERLSAIGYGESKPAVECECNKCLEEEFQINRRTTFTILE